MDTSVHPPDVSYLHHEFDGWLGDDLLEAFPCFLVTDRLAEALEKSDLTGWSLSPVEVSTSPEFDDLHDGRKLPAFRWLRLGRTQTADMYFSADHSLVVSDRALELLRRFSLDNAEIQQVAEEHRGPD